MSAEHEHSWNYEHAVYDATPNKCTIRRWCSECGLLQHTHTTGRWYDSLVGPGKLFGEYPDGYDPELISDPDFIEEPTHEQ